METYEYKVDAIQAAVTEKDINEGTAGAKVASQVELKLRDLAKQGYEFYREFPVDVRVQKGCFGSQSGNDSSVNIIVLVFRRMVK